MFTEDELNGTIIKSYVACKRQGWLASRKLSPSLLNPYIQLGTVYSNIRENKRRVGNIEIDEMVKGKHIIVKEYKKTFSNIEASKMQLLFYMKNLKNELNLKKIEGYIVSEETEEKLYVYLDKKNLDLVNKKIKEMISIINQDKAPEFKRTSLCDYCGHNLYCL